MPAMRKSLLLQVVFSALVFLSSLKVEATFSVSSCSMTCGEEPQKEMELPPSNQMWRPGKAGPRGPKGDRGSKGDKGMSGSDCDCKNQSQMAKTLVELTETVLQMNRKLQKDCYTMKLFGHRSGNYVIYPTPQFENGIEVYCNQDMKGGGWIVIQSRINGSVNFLRNWSEYVAGFGSISGEMWIGLELIHALTTSDHYELLVDLEDFDGNKAWAKYGQFSVSGPEDNFRLTAEQYSGNAGNGLAIHNGYQFTTIDSDNDSYKENCAKRFKGAWWYKACHQSNLNGAYDGTSNNADGVSWYPWRNTHRSLKSVAMMIRPNLA